MRILIRQVGAKRFVSLFLRGCIVPAVILAATAPMAMGVTFNTNDINVYNQFLTGGTQQNFENIAGMTPLSLNSYANALNSTTSVPVAAQLGLDIPGMLFHSGGGSFNNPTGNPGTPTALVQLAPPINGDAHSPTNVVGSLEINTEFLDLDNFVEVVFINSLQARVGVWLNPALGDVTFSAFDNTGSQLETVTGTKGNFVGIQRPNAEIKFVSIVGGTAGFTIDDLTFGGAGAPPPNGVPEPTTMILLGSGLLGLIGFRKTSRK
jgi:hypothetical protein